MVEAVFSGVVAGRNGLEGPYKPEVLVNVLSRSSGSGPIPTEAAQRLEGSRFVVWQFYSLAASAAGNGP